MARNTEPRLTAPDSVSEEQCSALALFLDTLSRHASETAAILGSYKSPADIIADSHDGSRVSSDSLNGQILRAVGPLFATEIDLDANPDKDTAAAMRQEITLASRRSASPEERRIIRMATFAGEVAAWAAQQELTGHSEQGQSEIGGSPAALTLAGEFTEPASLPETA